MALNTLADFGRDDGPVDAIAQGMLRGPVERFAALAVGGSDVDPLRLRPWGDHDGQVTDRFGVRWLIGSEG